MPTASSSAVTSAGGRILLIRLSAIGDILLTAPIVAALHARGYAVDFMVKAAYRSVVNALPGVGEVLVWEREAAQVRWSNYQGVVDLQATAKTAQFLRKAPHSLPVYKFKKPYIKRALLLWTKLPIFALSPVVERYADAVRPLLGPQWRPSHAPIEPGAAARTKVQTMFAQRGISEPPLVFVLGGSYKGKKMSYWQWNELVEKSKKFDLPIALLGGPQEAMMGESLEQPLGKNIFNFARDLTLLEGLALVSAARLVVSGDTGFMHAAAALQRPLVSLWGATHPHLGFSPWKARVHIPVITKSFLTPLSKHGKLPVPFLNPMNQLPLNQVVEAIEQILQDKTTP